LGEGFPSSDTIRLSDREGQSRVRWLKSSLGFLWGYVIILLYGIGIVKQKNRGKVLGAIGTGVALCKRHAKPKCMPKWQVWWLACQHGRCYFFKQRCFAFGHSPGLSDRLGLREGKQSQHGQLAQKSSHAPFWLRHTGRGAFQRVVQRSFSSLEFFWDCM
jgi:hypothetical protein